MNASPPSRRMVIQKYIGRFPDSRIILLPTPSHPDSSGQWPFVGFVLGHSGGAVPVSLRASLLVHTDTHVRPIQLSYNLYHIIEPLSIKNLDNNWQIYYDVNDCNDHLKKGG